MKAVMMVEMMVETMVAYWAEMMVVMRGVNLVALKAVLKVE